MDEEGEEEKSSQKGKYNLEIWEYTDKTLTKRNIHSTEEEEEEKKRTERKRKTIHGTNRDKEETYPVYYTRCCQCGASPAVDDPALISRRRCAAELYSRVGTDGASVDGAITGTAAPVAGWKARGGCRQARDVGPAVPYCMVCCMACCRLGTGQA
eukprot:scpid98130/ scgid21659/ 